MRTTIRVVTFGASCVMAAALSADFSGGAPAAAQTAAEPVSKTCRVGPRSREVEIQKIEPFKMFDNLYHVGPCYVAVYLLTTPQGDILFDTTQEPFVDKLIDNIQKIGVNPRDIKYIVINHGHLDHFGGAARMQELTGARVAAIAEDWTMIEAADGKTGTRDSKTQSGAQARHGGQGRRSPRPRRSASDRPYRAGSHAGQHVRGRACAPRGRQHL